MFELNSYWEMKWDFLSRAMVKSETSRVDWAMAEALAFGCLALHQREREEGTAGLFYTSFF